jgi:lipoyl(octanoyl) transferase
VNKKVIYKDLGLIEFGQAWESQKKLIASVQQGRKNKQEGGVNYLLFCEHPHVFTLGKSGSPNNLLADDDDLRNKGATFFHTDRGGDITYHGPGQIVGYPIFDLEGFKMGVKNYILCMEESIIMTLRDFGIQSERLEGATGVWLDVDKAGMTRKICAIGVKVSQSVTMHGFALNVNTNLSYFNLINPCGFVDKGVTSIAEEIGVIADMEEVKNRLKFHFSEVFDFRYC